MQVDYIAHMGSDLTVVNAARVSFNKESELVEGKISEKDEKLIKFLADHNHWTPFGHCTIQFRVKAPIFIARQLGKHQIGLVWNEVSRRYVDYQPEFYFPDSWRGRPKDGLKQGSDENEEIEFIGDVRTGSLHNEVVALSKDYYNQMIRAGVSPEQARMLLPQSTYTEWYWSGSLYAFFRVCQLRLHKSAQKEARDIAQKIFNHCQKLFPISWKYLNN